MVLLLGHIKDTLATFLFLCISIITYATDDLNDLRFYYLGLFLSGCMVDGYFITKQSHYYTEFGRNKPTCFLLLVSILAICVFLHYIVYSCSWPIAVFCFFHIPWTWIMCNRHLIMLLHIFKYGLFFFIQEMFSLSSSDIISSSCIRMCST